MHKIGALLIAVALAIAALAVFVGFGFGTVSSPPTTGLIVPLYSYPTSSTWSALIQAKQADPSVPVIAIINPDSGSGSVSDPNYVTGVASLQSAGISVIGYAYTGYGGSSLSSIESNVSDYKSFYNVNGILFDAMSSSTSTESYYSTLNSYAKSLGMSITVGGAGNAVPSSFMGILSMYVIYEGAGLPSTTLLASATGGYAKSNFAMVSYDVSSSSLNQTYVTSASNYVSYMYITDATLPNPYTVLPSYLLSLMAYLAPPSSSASTSLLTAATTTSALANNATTIITTTSATPILNLSWNQVETLLVIASLVIAAAAVFVAVRKR